MFINVPTTTNHLPLSSDRPIHSTYSLHPLSLTSPSISSSHLCLNIPSGFLPIRITTKILFPSLLTPNFPKAHLHLFFLLPSLNQIHNIVEQYRSLSSPLCSLLHTKPTDCRWLTPTLNIINCHM